LCLDGGASLVDARLDLSRSLALRCPYKMMLCRL
jgi:hypothetical protein